MSVLVLGAGTSGSSAGRLARSDGHDVAYFDDDPDDLHKNNLGQAKKDAKDKPDKPVKSTPPGLAKRDKNKG